MTITEHNTKRDAETEHGYSEIRDFPKESAWVCFNRLVEPMKEPLERC